MSIYDELSTGGDYVSFKEHGDKVAGDLIEVRKGKDFKGNDCPEWIGRTDDGRDHTVTCGQANLKAQALSLRPMPGDRVSVEYVRDEKADKGMKKIFDVKVKTGGAKGTEAADGGESYGDEDPF